MLAQPRHHHKNSPQAENDARHGGQQFDEHDQRLAQPERGEFGEINGRGDADGHGDDERDGRRHHCAEDERQRAELLIDRVPIAANEEVPAELLQRQPRTLRQFVPDQHDEHEDRQRHEQGEPLESAVAETEASRHRHGRHLHWLGLVHILLIISSSPNQGQPAGRPWTHRSSSLPICPKIKRTKSGRNNALRPAHA